MGSAVMKHPAMEWHYPAFPMVSGKLTTTQAVGRNLRLLMSRVGMTQMQLAKKSGVSQRHISNILNASNEAGIEKVNRLARVFGLEGWQLQMPNIPEGMLESGVISRVVESLREATPQGRDMIERLAEREAFYSKQRRPNDQA